jgi:hypothetical protein
MSSAASSLARGMISLNSAIIFFLSAAVNFSPEHGGGSIPGGGQTFPNLRVIEVVIGRYSKPTDKN